MLVTKSLPDSADGQVSLGTVVAMAGLIPWADIRVDQGTPVLGACLAEGTDGTSALEPGWLIVVDGLGLSAAGDPALRSFVRDASTRAAAGIVLRLGPVWTEPPAAVVDEARHARLPLFVLPPETTVSAFLRQVHESAGIRDVAVLSTAMGLQAELIGALSSPDVEGELIRRVATSLDVSAMLYDGRGEAIAVQGEAPVHMIADLVGSASEADERRMVGRWQVSISPISAGSAQYTLAIAWPHGRDLDGELLRSSRFAFQQLLRAHSRTVASERLQDQVQRGQVLGELLEGVTDARLLRLRDGLVLLRFPPEGSFQVHLISLAGASGGHGQAPAPRHEPDPVLLAVQQCSLELGVPALMGSHGSAHAILHAASDAFTDSLLVRMPDRAHGVSSAFSDLTSSPSALRQAQTSLSASRRNGQFTAFHRVGFVDFILGHLPEQILQERTTEVLGELDGNDAVMSTLVEYMRNGLDIQRTARALHLHPNSIRYRLSRAEDQLGRSITDPETITLLYLALHERIARPTGPRMSG